MDEDIYYDFQEPINLEELYEKYETYNVKQLAIIIKTFYFNRNKIKKSPFRTTEQEKQFDKFSKFMGEEYPWLIDGKYKYIHKGAIDLSQKQRDKNNKIWTRELDKFREACKLNNNLYYTDDVLTKINEIIKGKSTHDKNAYGNEQIMCECGCLSLRKNIASHRKTKIHERKLAISKEITFI